MDNKKRTIFVSYLTRPHGLNNNHVFITVPEEANPHDYIKSAMRMMPNRIVIEDKVLDTIKNNIEYGVGINITLEKIESVGINLELLSGKEILKMAENKENKDVTLLFSEKMIVAQKNVQWDGKDRTQSLVALPKNAEHRGFLWQTTVPIRDSEFAKGMKYAYVDPDYPHYKLVNTPRDKDGNLDFENQEVLNVTGKQLKEEIEAYKNLKKEKTAEAEESIDIDYVDTSVKEEDGPEL